jgi:glutamine amidotransferase
VCRWLAYCGEPLRPSELTLHPQHSLIAQSLDSPLGTETVNGDGLAFLEVPESTVTVLDESGYYHQAFLADEL